MVREISEHTWRCPICSETKTSLATMDTMNASAQAELALVSHVRTMNGGGHSRAGEHPPGFDPDTVPEYVEVQIRNGDEPREREAVN